jgi:hypothetical protein
MTIPRHSKVHTTKRKYYHIETLNKDLNTKKRNFPKLMNMFFSKAVPYPVSSCLGKHRVFLGSLVLSQPSGNNELMNEDEDKTLSTNC